MKMLLATVALAATIASPALAQTASRVPNQVRNPSVQTTDHQRPSSVNNVYNSAGKFVGSDPDPRIREDLQRDEPGRTE
jgi:hypothetical protein